MYDLSTINVRGNAGIGMEDMGPVIKLRVTSYLTGMTDSMYCRGMQSIAKENCGLSGVDHD